DEEIKKFGFHQNLDEPSVYQKASGSNVIFLILYVDDIILMANHKPSLQEVKDYLELQVKCYCDAGFKTDRDDTKSQTGYVFTLNGGAVVWKRTKQSTTAQHAAETEYIAAAKAAKEAGEPASYKAALSDPEFEKWLVAMNAKIQSMYDNKVWKLIDLPPGIKVVKSKWIYKKKTDMDGVVYIYKARLVAKGFTQTYDVDYKETFVADIRAIRILMAIAAYYDYEIWKMDVKTAFFNGFLDKEIYMEQPEDFVDPDLPRKASGSNVILLILYVDDIILMGNHKPSLQEVKDYLGKCFFMKDLGDVAYILGIKIYRDRLRQLIGLSQDAYLDKILKRYRMDGSKRGTIPMQVDCHLDKSQCAESKDDKARMKNVPYDSAVGSIMYDVRCTRPNVTFTQNITSQFQQSPGEAHWTAVKNILKYLRITKDMFLVYGGNSDAELQVKCYCDAGFETDRDDTKSQTGYVFTLNGGVIVWKSSKQSTTSQHAAKAEYIAAAEAAKEEVWIKNFVDELGVVPSNNQSY
nr:hypothetical protein [Tanacetum cinerariifolium]